jgi:hypothetical protein
MRIRIQRRILLKMKWFLSDRGQVAIHYQRNAGAGQKSNEDLGAFGACSP